MSFETKKEAQRELADINQYPGWKALLYYSKHKIEEKWEEGQADTNILTEEKNRKKSQTYHLRHEDTDEEITVIHNRDESEMECHARGLKRYKIKQYRSKPNITL